MEDYKQKEEKPNGGIVLEDFNEGEGFYKINLAYLNTEQVIEIEELVEKWNPELKESVDEKIRKYIINHFQEHLDTCKRFVSDGMFPPFSAAEIKMLEASIVWLEKQDPKKHEEELKNAYKCADEVQYRRGYEDAKREFKKQGEQKPAWSEEDESHIYRILSYLESFKAYNIPHIEPIKKEIDWLKSLKDRMKGE